jgi:excisionase family DNA binding protein
MELQQLPFAMKAEDIAKFLNVSRSKAYDIMNQKDFPTITLGKSKRVKSEDFLRWLESQKQAI